MALIPTYILRLTLQHRALYCYLVLSLWILILLGGMYKYLLKEDDSLNLLKLSVTDFTGYSTSNNVFRESVGMKYISKVCKPPQEIKLGLEGLVNINYSLQGVMVLIRHGDRGPLSHIRNTSSVNCLGESDPLYKAFENHISNITGTSLMSQLLSNFHGFPALPGQECSLGQLTRVGASQLLHTGKLLRSVYGDNLGLMNSSLLKKEVIVYSTRYRRTLQSALAFLYSFLSQEDFHKASLQEVQSLSFCFDDCACPAADLYYKHFLVDAYRILRSRTDIIKLVKMMSDVIYEIPDRKLSSDPHALKDALLTYVCHGASLPCIDAFIPETCIQSTHVTELFSYLNTEANFHHSSNYLKRSFLLRSYGLVRNIVSYILRLVSEKKPKVVLYSGHDKTLSYITSALGIVTEDTAAPPYASRLIFEIYKNRFSLTSSDLGPIGSEYSFRLLFNGKDVTKEVTFCKKFITVPLRNSKIKHEENSKAFLCPIESIIRFIHDDYFTIFNVTNMKDACVIPTS